MTGASMLFYSANEIAALVERALRGAGLPLAQARLLTAAAVKGELWGLKCLASLAKLAESEEPLRAFADQAVTLCDQVCQQPELEISLAKGSEVDSEEGSQEESEVGSSARAARKRLLIAALANCPVPDGKLLYLEAGGVSLFVSSSQQWLADTGEGAGLVARWMPAGEGEGLLALGGYRALADRVQAAYAAGLSVDSQSVIAPLATLAHRTYVPATVASRQQAGAGETDND